MSRRKTIEAGQAVVTRRRLASNEAARKGALVKTKKTVARLD